MPNKQKVYFIVGPTASGKTDAAIEVALRLNAEIISADSIQIYKQLDIGSAKPSVDEMRGVPHHLLDFVEISDGSFNVAKFKEEAEKKIAEITSRGKAVLVVGGTGLYVNSLIFPLDFSKAKPDQKRRAELTAMEETEPGSLHNMLEAIDPTTAAKLHKNDTKRIVRAIEVYEQTGEPLSAVGGDFTNERGADIGFIPILAGISRDRAKLYERIERRVDIMMTAGLLNEVDGILSRNLDPALPALQGLGYKQLIMYRKGELDLNEAVELIKRDTRRFAKRQISWFKRDKRIKWFDADLLGADLSNAIYDYFITAE